MRRNRHNMTQRIYVVYSEYRRALDRTMDTKMTLSKTRLRRTLRMLRWYVIAKPKTKLLKQT